MWTTDPYTELRLTNDRHRERIAAAALRRSVAREPTRRHALAGLRVAARSAL